MGRNAAVARRDFLKCSLAPVAGWPLASCLAQAAAAADQPDDGLPTIIDTNVTLFSWPFRRLKYGQTQALVEKLRKHRVAQAWAGSFEALLHKNLDAVNRRLAEECRTHGRGLLVPLGTVNPAWPDWREDLRRCRHEYAMPGIRLFPTYHHYRFDEPEFARLLELAAQQGLVVQIALEMEDPRVEHPALQAAEIAPAALVDVLRPLAGAKVQLLNWSGAIRGRLRQTLVEQTDVALDISHVEGNGGLLQQIEGGRPLTDARIAPSRLLFGSHAPMFPCESAVLKLFESPLDRPTLEAIMHRSAVRLLEGSGGAAADPPSERAAERRDGLSFALDPAAYGVPNRQELVGLRIWDGHYHGFNSEDGIRQHEETMFYVKRMGIERVVALDIASVRRDPFAPSAMEDRQREILTAADSPVSGIIRIDPSDPVLSCRKMEEWIARGPCIGIKYAGFNRDGLPCSHPNNDPIIRLAAELGAVVYIHTWLKIGGQPRRPGGGNNPGESTPMDVALLAERFGGVSLICGHSGGDWELGIRAIRPHANVYLEFSGSDPHSGQVDLAVAELGVERIVWGGHGPTRSYSTELSKVLDANLGRAERMQILGGNLRRLAGPIMRRKGYTV